MQSTRRSGSCTIAAMRLSLALALIAVITIEGGLGYSFLREQEEKKARRSTSAPHRPVAFHIVN